MYHCANKSGEELALKLVAYLMKSESNLLTWNFNRSYQQGVQPSQIPKSTYYFYFPMHLQTLLWIWHELMIRTQIRIRVVLQKNNSQNIIPKIPNEDGLVVVAKEATYFFANFSGPFFQWSCCCQSLLSFQKIFMLVLPTQENLVTKTVVLCFYCMQVCIE